MFANADTSCPFARNIQAAYQGPGSDFEEVFSPVTNQAYGITYTQSGGEVFATGGTDISVQFSF